MSDEPLVDDCPEVDVARTAGQAGASAMADYQELIERDPSLI